MMNQYLCRKYLAEDVANHISFLPQLNRRIGHPKKYHGNLTSPHETLLANQNNLILDEGSSAYQNWLSR